MANSAGGSSFMSARVKRAEGIEALTAASRQRAQQIDYTTKRFLVIDAAQQMRAAMNATLNTLGANKVDYSNRAVEAVSMIKRTDYDIVLCDFDLGRGFDGLHLLDEIRRSNILKPSAIFVMVTGESRARMVMSAAEMAPDAYLLKPFTGEDLKRRLDRVYRRKAEFKSLDAAMLSNDYLKAIAECNERISKRDTYWLEFIKLKGRIALLIGDYALARETYQTALLARETAWAKMGMAKALFHLKEYAESRRMFEEVLFDNNRVMEAYDWLARIHQAEHEYKEAQAVLMRAVELSPAIMLRQKRLGQVALRNGDFGVATQAFKETITLAKHSFGRDAADYLNLSKAQMHAGEIIEATKTAGELRREFRLDPRAELLATLVECNIALKQKSADRAEQLLQKAKQNFAGAASNAPDGYAIELAEVCYRLDDDDTATDIIKKVLKNHHEDSVLLERIGTMFDDVGKADLGQALIESNAQRIVAVNNEAVMMAQAGDLEGAVGKFIRAVEEMPGNAQVMLNALNALLAYVTRKGWHDQYMLLASQYLDRVKVLEPTSVKYLKLRDAYQTARRRFRA